MTLYYLASLLALKHFVADGPLQLPYQYLNKGKFGHPGGLLHATIHGVFTFGALAIVAPSLWWLAVADAVAHYFIDLVKTRMTKREWAERAQTLNGTPCLAIYSDWYFYALVLGQALHFLCYGFILAYVAGLS